MSWKQQTLLCLCSGLWLNWMGVAVTAVVLADVPVLSVVGEFEDKAVASDVLAELEAGVDVLVTCGGCRAC